MNNGSYTPTEEQLGKGPGLAGGNAWPELPMKVSIVHDLKGKSHEILDFGFFHETTYSGPGRGRYYWTTLILETIKFEICAHWGESRVSIIK